MPNFLFKFFFQYLFQINEKHSSKWSVGDHIFLYAIWKIIRRCIRRWFCDFWSKIFRKFSPFFAQKFSNLICWNHQLKILRMPSLTLFKYALVLFLSSCLNWWPRPFLRLLINKKLKNKFNLNLDTFDSKRAFFECFFKRRFIK
jgi:hypothetical protein